MKQLISMLIALAALLCLGGCKRTDDEIAGTFVINDYPASSPAESEEDEAATELDFLEEPKPALLNGMKEIDETTISFDLEALSFLSTERDEDGVFYEISTEETTYSKMLDCIEKDGIIVAGHAIGLRESCEEPGKAGFTLTRFIVDDLYYGTAPSEIIIQEAYYLSTDEDNEWCFRKPTISSLPRLENDQSVLLFLWKDLETGHYFRQLTTIRLNDDYRDYNEEYETHLLNFFRGEPSEYAEKDDARVEYYLNENNEEVPYFVSSTIVINPWPKRDISNEALLAELQENIVVRLATDFKIKIWPYGHKNYIFGYSNSAFAKWCMPDS